MPVSLPGTGIFATVDGCPETAFNGTFDLRLERAGPSKIVLHFGARRGAGSATDDELIAGALKKQ